MHMVVRLQNEASQEIRDREVMTHDQLVKYHEQATKEEADIQKMKTKKEEVVNKKTKAFEDMQ